MEDLPQTTPLDYIPIDQFLQEPDKKDNAPSSSENKNIDSLVEKLRILEEKNRFLENQVLELKLNSKELFKVLKTIRDTIDQYFVEENLDNYSE